MADQIDPQDIKDLNENLRSLTETLGKASGAGKAGASLGGSGGVGDMLGLSKKTSATLDALGSSAADLTKNLAAGKKGAQVFTDALEGLATAIYLIPGLGQAAKLAALGLVAFAKTAGAITKQGDSLFKTYQELGKVGATASTGLQGVFTNMQKFGYGIEELDKMVALVTQNSETLAKFSLTAADGTSAFASAMTGLVRDKGLRELGKLPDDINAAGAAYIRQSVASGLSQKQIGDSLASGTRQYIMDLDRLQRLTGKSADKLQKEQDAAMAESAYNQVMAELKARAAAGDKVAQAEIDKIITVGAYLNDELRQDYVRSIGGDISAGTKIFMALPSLMKNVTDENVSTLETLNEANKDAINVVTGMGQSAKLNAQGFDENYSKLQGLREFMVSTTDLDERTLAAKRNSLILDKSTKNLAAVDLANMNSRDALQSFVQLGVEPATNALRIMANIANGGTGMLPGGVGVGGANSFGDKLMGLGGKAAGGSANADAAMKFFMSAGWSKEQAAGIVGNLQAESGKDLSTTAVGDGGKAKGIAQWHPDRQAIFKNVMGKDVMSATLEEQLRFVDYELKNTEKSAGDKLRAAATAAQAAQLVDSLYERSTGGAIASRIANANSLAGGRSGWQSTMNGVNPASTLPPSVDGEKAKNAAVGWESENILGMIASGLASLDRNTRESNDKLAKISTNTQ